MTMRVVDAHLDIAYNALKFGRDPRRSVQEMRAAEKPEPFRGTASVSFPQLREAQAVLIFATIFAMPERAAGILGGDTRLTYQTPDEAHSLAMDQLDYYRRLVEDEENNLRLVTNLDVLDELESCPPGDEALLGLVPLMEGAGPVREPLELELWIEKGLRAIGLAWDDTPYAGGSWFDSRQGLTAEGLALLDIMADYRLILDLTHMNDQAAFEALDAYAGPLMASHSNVRALVPGPRQLSDQLIRRIGEHEGVIGIALFNAFLRANHTLGDPKALVTLDHVVAHIDHICQLLGSAQYVGLGTDMDGGFGAGDIPTPLDSSADLRLLTDRLRLDGYEDDDIACIMGGNWLRLLRTSLSD